MRIGIAGWYSVSPAREVPVSLDELIYSVTSSALDKSGMTIDDIGAVSMAASDLNDGRAISTMTLTGSTGSYHKTEMRVCNESLAALWLGAAEIVTDTAPAIMICAWNKASDSADPVAIDALAMEPVATRPLNFHPDAILALRQSAERGVPTLTRERARIPMDTASALVIVAADDPRASGIVMTGHGSAQGPYLRPGDPVLRPLQLAAQAAMRTSGKSAAEFSTVSVAGLSRIDDDEIASALGVSTDVITRQQPDGVDLGYAGGLTAVTAALESGLSGPTLFVSAGGLGAENAHAIVLENA